MKTSVLFFAMTLSNLLICQESSFQYEQIKIKEVVKNEIKMKGEEFIPTYQKFNVLNSYFPNANKYVYDQPKIYLRPDSSFVTDLEIQYYFSKKDNIVRIIFYEWDTKKLTNDVMADLLNKNEVDTSIYSLKVFNTKYDDLMDNLINEFGDPSKDNGNIKIENNKHGKLFRRKATWFGEDCNIELSMIWSSIKHENEDLSSTIPTYRIVMKIYWN